MAALERLFAGPELAFTAASSMYETPPWGVTDQPAFANAAAIGTTAISPHALLAFVQRIEIAGGRVASVRWGPRAIDIDLIDMEGIACATAGLTLPHPRLFERAFVLVPLAEIAPDRIIGGRRIGDATAGLVAGPVIAQPWQR